MPGIYRTEAFQEYSYLIFPLPLQNVSNVVLYFVKLDIILLAFPMRIKHGRILPHKIDWLINIIIWDELPWHFVINILKTKLQKEAVLDDPSGNSNSLRDAYSNDSSIVRIRTTHRASRITDTWIHFS
ncbi:hypothetical protein PoB_005781200 [Plakobranchus ocellatus]|uniref:Uncharacterized protein n=1 Tax=Plakobranchus ocellatus TaxID=259542 RepID=A0AAV4CIW7_9GAST|nr:hypothetical protein PoB_005781200 [Plakobranchus ocellatus]